MSRLIAIEIDRLTGRSLAQDISKHFPRSAVVHEHTIMNGF